MSYLNIKYCKKCKQAFDIGTNLDLCPICRKELMHSAVKKDNNNLYLKLSNSKSFGSIMTNALSRRLSHSGLIPNQRTVTKIKEEGENGEENKRID